MRPMSRFAEVIFGCALLTSGCMRLDFWNRPESPPLAIGPHAALLAPEIIGEDFSGTPFKLSDYRGNVVVLSFWTSG